jgi:MFS family permease
MRPQAETRTTRSGAALKRPQFWVVAAAIAVVMSGSAAPSPLYPVYQHLWGFSSAMLTVVFGVYVGGLLLSLLTVGALSDHVGRRPVIVVSLLVLVVAMIVFATAGGVGALLAARILQGLGTGAAMGTLSAALVDLRPGQRAGSLVTSTAPIAGLGLGVVASAVLVQYAPSPRRLVYEIIAALLIVLIVTMLTVVPETSPRSGFISRAHVARTLTPKVSVPSEVRSAFTAGIPALIAVWALAGLDLSLGPSIVASQLGIANHAAAGALLSSFFFAAAAAAPLASVPRRPVRLQFSYAMLGIGLVLQLTGSLTGLVAAYTIGLLAAGVGFSTAYVGVIASLAHAPAGQRSGLFAALYVVSYLAFSVPALVGGITADVWGLRSTTAGYTVFVILMVALAASRLRSRSRRLSSPAAEPNGQPRPALARDQRAADPCHGSPASR